jgi:hypothetical protein
MNSTSDANAAKTDNLYELSIQIVMSNRMALDAFKQYLNSINQERYLFFWLHVENFRNSAEKLATDGLNRNQSNTSRISEFLRGKNTSSFQLGCLQCEEKVKLCFHFDTKNSNKKNYFCQSFSVPIINITKKNHFYLDKSRIFA